MTSLRFQVNKTNVTDSAKPPTPDASKAPARPANGDASGAPPEATDPFEAPDLSALAPQTRLILATIAEIEAVGLGAVRVRGIVARAEMNVASVSYHFGSKSALVDAAMRGALSNMMTDANAYLGRVALAPEPALIDLVSYFLEGAARYPRLTQAHLQPVLASGDYTGPFAGHFGDIARHLRDLLREVRPTLSRDEAEGRVNALLSATFFPAFFGGLFAQGFATPSERRRYATRVVRQALG